MICIPHPTPEISADDDEEKPLESHAVFGKALLNETGRQCERETIAYGFCGFIQEVV